jgi:hypothetical protein
MTKRCWEEEDLKSTSRREELIDRLKLLRLDDPFELPSFQDVASVFGLGGLPRVCDERVAFGKGGSIDFYLIFSPSIDFPFQQVVK